MASEAQAGAKPSGGRTDALSELNQIVRSAPKCPPNVNCEGLIAFLGITAGLYLALKAINDGLGTAGTHGCNWDICQTVMRFIDRDINRINELMSRARGLISEGKLDSEVLDLITNEASQVIEDVTHYYPVAIDLLARYGRGRPRQGQGV